MTLALDADVSYAPLGLVSAASFPVTTSSDDEIIIVVGRAKSAWSGTVSDTAGLAWTVRSLFNNSGTYWIEAWAIAPAAVTTTITIPMVSDGYPRLLAFSLPGVATDAPFDPSTSLPLNYGPIEQSGSYPSFSTTEANEFVFFWADSSGGANVPAGSPWTNFSSDPNNACAGWLLSSSAGTFTPADPSQSGLSGFIGDALVAASGGTSVYLLGSAFGSSFCASRISPSTAMRGLSYGAAAGRLPFSGTSQITGASLAAGRARGTLFVGKLLYAASRLAAGGRAVARGATHVSARSTAASHNRAYAGLALDLAGSGSASSRGRASAFIGRLLSGRSMARSAGLAAPRLPVPLVGTSRVSTSGGARSTLTLALHGAASWAARAAGALNISVRLTSLSGSSAAAFFGRSTLSRFASLRSRGRAASSARAAPSGTLTLKGATSITTHAPAEPEIIAGLKAFGRGTAAFFGRSRAMLRRRSFSIPSGRSNESGKPRANVLTITPARSDEEAN